MKTYKEFLEFAEQSAEELFEQADDPNESNVKILTRAAEEFETFSDYVDDMLILDEDNEDEEPDDKEASFDPTIFTNCYWLTLEGEEVDNPQNHSEVPDQYEIDVMRMVGKMFLEFVNS